MTNAQLKAEIVAYSESIGIDKIGFASADPFHTLKQRLETQRKLGYESGFEEKDLEKRTNPKKILPEAQSLIAIALAYPAKMKNAPKSIKGERRGIFCRASWGEDYHRILKDRMEKLTNFIIEKVPNAKVISMVDTGALVDRAVAERAGIGWSGKNCAIISPEYGSYIYLGELVTSILFPPDKQIEDQCGDCNRCVKACPTGALVEGGQINAKKCIAYLTQTKDFIPLQYRDKIGNRLYGCDTCQQVCPKNKGIDFHLHEEMEPDPEIVKPKLTPILNLSNKQFKQTYGKLSGSWRGKNPIQRNALIALAHYKDESALSEIKNILFQDPRPVMRGIAAWSMTKIAGKGAEKILLDALEKESEPDVRAEIENSLRMIQSTCEN